MPDKFLDYTIKVLTDLASINQVESDWNELLYKTSTTNIYIDPVFYHSQFNNRSPGCTPYLVFFYKNAQIVGLIIAKKKDKRIPIKLGYWSFQSPKINSLDIEIDGIVFLREQIDSEIIISYLNKLLNYSEIGLIEFQHFSERNQLWNFFTRSEKIIRCITSPGYEYLINLRDSITGESIDHHKAKTKRNFKRADRIIKENFNQLELKLYKTSDQIPEFLDNSEIICKKSYHCELGIGVQNTDEWRKKIGNMIDGGYFFGFILYGDNTPLAYNFGLIYQNVFYGFNMSFDLDYRKLQPGTYLLRRMIEELRLLEINYFHLGYGYADYKKLYSNVGFNEATIILFGNTVKSRLIYIILKISVKLNISIKNGLEKFGLVNKIKRIWRTKLSSSRL